MAVTPTPSTKGHQEQPVTVKLSGFHLMIDEMISVYLGVPREAVQAALTHVMGWEWDRQRKSHLSRPFLESVRSVVTFK